MSSYLNNLLTNTTSRYNNLRRQILSDEADGDTEDDSHLSRVLRAYYAEKGRPFPQWLPPDPKAPQAAPAQFASSSLRQQGQASQMGRGGGLSDLWDNPPQQQAQEPLTSKSRQTIAEPTGWKLPELLGRAPTSRSFTAPSAGIGSGTSAQERLKARLWGRSQSPAQRNMSSESVNSNPASPRGYEQSAPQGGRAPYADERSKSYGSTGSGSGRQQGSYGMSSNSPWSGGDDPYAPQGGGGGGYGNAPPPQRGPQGGRMGLPSGPRMR
ncbi:hypothetical protein HRS9122_05261 [Pyrenophora teres f. teres]|nr:hypothetical protein HRS9122_05261 [Pyrenophora teres f. teres]